ncbi:hypothetical protein LTR37_007299 [Vermiconidia calcicola]|uniref:Uncharacterized protein n=1 Tax=Vermiconidia calcicola TaxID=1690605 RepID=A0ACC3NDK4_9PEZI|nr:hypothetical protein LTR37_007299 [Vermiconidia calcicola]
MSLHELFFGFNGETIASNPECFYPSNVDPRKRERTASMHAALTQLGYETYHGFRAFANIQDYQLWNPANETKFLGKPSSVCPVVDKSILDKTLGDMNAVTDLPAVAFWAELIEAYPEAKVVLVERDIERWYSSFERVFIVNYESLFFQVIAWLDPKRTGLLNTWLHNGVARCQFRAGDGQDFRANARGVYKAHYAGIRELLELRGETETRLLEFDMSSGWGPLCRFLGKEVPEGQPFPRTNEDKMIQGKIRVMLIHGLRKKSWEAFMMILPAISFAGLAWCIWRLTR